MPLLWRNFHRCGHQNGVQDRWIEKAWLPWGHPKSQNPNLLNKWKIGRSNIEEAVITENVFIWVRKALLAITNINPDLQQVLKLSLSGSIAEGCRLKTRKPDIELDPEKVLFFLLAYKLYNVWFLGNSWSWWIWNWSCFGGTSRRKDPFEWCWSGRLLVIRKYYW